MMPLADQLAALGLRYTAAHLDDVVALATKRRWSTTQLLEHLAESEQHAQSLQVDDLRLPELTVGADVPHARQEHRGTACRSPTTSGSLAT